MSTYVPVGILNSNAWDTITATYHAALQNIDEAVKRVEQVAILAERQSQIIDLANFKKALSLRESEEVRLKAITCNTIPVARNKRFFGREEIINTLDEVLRPTPSSSGMCSVAIYGLGGVGKIQIALEYAWSRRGLYDAVLWIPAETTLAVEQSMNDTALAVLNLPGVETGATKQNTVLFMNWLKFTGTYTLFCYLPTGTKLIRVKMVVDLR